MRNLLTALVAAASIGAAAIATSSSAEAWRGGWGWGWAPGAVVGGVIAGAVVGSAIASRPYHTTDTDQIPITDRPAAACGTATPGCLLASYQLT